MSGRIRTIKPELLDDEPTAALSDAAWRIYMSLHLCADDYGNARLGNNYVAAMVWQDTSRDASEALTELVTKRFVIPFAKSEQRYGHIRGWDKHQRIDNRGKGRVPAMSEDDGSLPMWFRMFRVRFAESPEAAVPTRGEPVVVRGDTPGEDPGSRPRAVSPREVDHDHDPEGIANVVAVKPAPTKREKAGKDSSKGERLPEDWEPTAEQVAELAAEHHVDPLGSLRRFKNHFGSMTGRNKNAFKPRWDMAFANWVDRDVTNGLLPKVEPEKELPIIRHPDRDKYIPKPGEAVSPDTVLSLFGVQR